MRKLSGLFLLWSASALGQLADSNPVKEERYALVTLNKYCKTVEAISHSEQPRLFAQTASGLGPSSGWVEFSNMDTWKRAGQPQPLALVWYKDGAVARVAITARDPSRDELAYVDYCYRPDGLLARLRSVPVTQTKCDRSMFHCSLTFWGERFYYPKPFLQPSAGPEGKTSVAAPLPDVLDLNDFDQRPLKSERTSLALASPDWPEYLTVRELPFNGLLYASTK